MYIDFWAKVNILTVTHYAFIYESRKPIIFLLLVVFITKQKFLASS